MTRTEIEAIENVATASVDGYADPQRYVWHVQGIDRTFAGNLMTAALAVAFDQAKIRNSDIQIWEVDRDSRQVRCTGWVDPDGNLAWM